MKVRNRAMVRKLEIEDRIQMMSSIKDAVPASSKSPDPQPKTIEPAVVHTFRRSISNISMTLRPRKEDFLGLESPRLKKPIITIEEIDSDGCTTYKKSLTFASKPSENLLASDSKASAGSISPDHLTEYLKEKKNSNLLSGSLSWKSKANPSQNTSRLQNSLVASEYQSEYLGNSMLSQASPNAGSVLSYRSYSKDQDFSGLNLHSFSNEIFSTKASESRLWHLKNSLGSPRKNFFNPQSNYLNSPKNQRPEMNRRKLGMALYPMNSYPVYMALWSPV